MKISKINFTMGYLKHKFVFYNLSKNKTILVMPSELLFYLNLHLILSVINYTTQLVEGTAYEVPNFIKRNSDLMKKVYKNTQILIVYIYFQPLTEHFVKAYAVNKNVREVRLMKSVNSSLGVKSIESLYNNANWVEREISEMFGVLFSFKNDLRNLLLMYGDIIIPMLKVFPSTGLIEYLYSLWVEFVERKPLNS